MLQYPQKITLCGFGGQGIILTAVMLGTAAVTKGGLYAVQTQSYGSEARGGQCQAELIIDTAPINSPVAEKKNLLVALFQSAYEKYIPTLSEDGVLVIDPQLVTDLTHADRSGSGQPHGGQHGRAGLPFRVPRPAEGGCAAGCGEDAGESPLCGAEHSGSQGRHRLCQGQQPLFSRITDKAVHI